jgi:hypothetical protein
MPALDNFISPVLGFDGDILIPVVPVLAQLPSDEPTSDPSFGASASASKTRFSKRKAAANATPQKKAKKATRRSSSGIRIDEPTPKAPALTPPSGTISIHRSKRCVHHEYVSSLTIFLIHELLCRVPQDIDLDPSGKSALAGGESSKVDKPPESSS